MKMRLAEPRDAAAMAALATELGYPSTAAQIADRMRLLKAPIELHAVYVAEEPEGAPVGWMHLYVAYNVESDPSVEIGGLVVAEGRRGSGIGAALVAEAERWARSRGLGRLRVRSNVVRDRAHHFYEREGFARTKSQFVFVKTLD
jgi:GNAT superfamily N-acetyltransferase